jgi:hypothetical protein
MVRGTAGLRKRHPVVALRAAIERFEEAREIRAAALRQLAFVAGRLADADVAAGPRAHVPAGGLLSPRLTAVHCAEHRLTVLAQLAGIAPREAP